MRVKCITEDCKDIKICSRAMGCIPEHFVHPSEAISTTLQNFFREADENRVGGFSWYIFNDDDPCTWETIKCTAWVVKC